jgi:hypothetical protein
MRILSNFTYKDNGSSYSVTLETLGDCPADQVDAKIDELFATAKKAVERQVNLQLTIDDLLHTKDAAPGSNNNNNGKNGNGVNGKKDEYSKCTAKQKHLIIKLAKERGQFIGGIDDMSKADASYVIEDLLAVHV